MSTATRRAGPADAAAVDALTQAAYAKWVPIMGRKPLPMTADYVAAVVAHRIDLVERDGVLAALVELEHNPDHLLIVNLAVAPRHQGKGLGSLLLAHAEDVARELGLAEMRLFTNQLMAPNIALYGRHGYMLESEVPMPNGGVALDMRKRLPPG